MHQLQRDGGPLNIAATWVGTRALGPGRRSVAWVQGCPFRCAGCVAPDWIPDRSATSFSSSELAARLLTDPHVTGLTFSGGEPMMQAAGLAATARAARRHRPLSLICFTGFRLERLRADPPSAGVADLLAEVDVLIDGVYAAPLNDGRGLRGSTNQRVHHLTGRLLAWDADLVSGPRTVEVAVSGPEAVLIGVPPAGFVEVFDSAVDRLAGRLVGARVGVNPQLIAEV
jgi:anaerobic ribonucleoside-triphosphate reductase activating protein